MPVWDSARRVGIWGLGREGRAALDFLRGVRPDAEYIVLSDDPVAAPEDVGALHGAQAIDAIAGGRFDLIVKSPGISLRRPEIAAGRAAGTRFTSGTNLWFEVNGSRGTVVVTGTKGKSTTATLLDAILRGAGRDVRLLGNVGRPAIGQAPGGDHTVLELSSYQIADLEYAPELALVTNLYPEHAPWHGGVETYFAEKLRVAAIEPAATLFANAADARLCERLAGRVDHWFNAGAGFHVREDALWFDDAPVTLANSVLRGAHNLTNLAGAASVARALGVSGLERVIDLALFRPLAHRLEEVALANGVLAVDDSIATVPEACYAALQSYLGRPVHLILGGTDRGQDHAMLRPMLQQSRLRSVHVLPVTGTRLATEIAPWTGEAALVQAPDLTAAMESIFGRVEPGDVVLLSPAAPSFGQFASFEERGERFKALATALGGGTA